MGALLSLVAIVVLGLGAHQFYKALVQVEPTLPYQFRDKPAARFAIDIYVWNSQVPASARRQYLRSLGLMTTCFGLMTLALLAEERGLQALPIAAIFVIAAIGTLTRWIKHRGQF